jgi:hypothetical protein
MTAPLTAPAPAPPGATTRYLFVGERPSRRAVRIGATWHNGRLAACTLWRALEAAGLDPQDQDYLNVWMDAEPGAHDAMHEESARAIIRIFAAGGVTIVGMGAVVGAWLDRQGIAHRKLIHPAARGAIRRRDRYQEHVAAVLAGEGVRP